MLEWIFRPAVVVACMILATGTSQGTTLVGLYKFDDPSNLGLDSSGQGKNGTLYNDGILPTYSASGYVGGAASFSGTFNNSNQNFGGGGGRIDVPINTGPTAMPAMTWGAWVRPHLIDHGRYILSSDQYNRGRTIGIWDQLLANNTYSANTGLSPGFYATGIAPVTDVWIFVGGIFDNNYYSPGSGRLTMFVGDQKFSNISTNINTSSPSFTSIGGNAGGERYWNGLIDSVFIFDGAITDALGLLERRRRWQRPETER